MYVIPKPIIFPLPKNIKDLEDVKLWIEKFMVSFYKMYSTIHMNLYGSKTWDPPNLTQNAEAYTTITVLGAEMGDFVLASMSCSFPAGIFVRASVTDADEITVSIANHSGGSVDIDECTLNVMVIK